jgi:hydrogenase-4 component B
VTVFFLGIALIVAAGAAAWLLQGRTRLADSIFATLVTLGCATGLVPAVGVLVGDRASVGLSWEMGAPGGTWAFGIDSLSAVFLVVVLGVGLANALYGIAYLAPERAHRPVGSAQFLTGLFLAAMALVVTAQATMPFLVAWEVMALTAYLLVVFEDEQAEVRKAGLVYLAATHVGTLALVAMFALWGTWAGAFTFSALGRASLPAGGAVVLSLALVGFGLKAGLVPLHFWLPGAHASAPSHVSGLMSGVMIKTGIYGLLRVISLVGGVPAWWGWAVLALGILSGVLGVLWALAQHDLKRLLAYHSIENIGIILLGVGAGALGVAYREPAVAVLGFAAAVLHTVNHALFKSLLFLGAGAVFRATGTRAIDRLGGLARRMRWTWVAFLVGSVAIVGLPPLNGFVSEWLVYQGLLRGGLAVSPVRVAVLGVAALALIGGLALACFAKVGGVVFLGEPRSPAAEQGRELTAGYLVPMAALALACAVIGLLPSVAVAPVLAVAGSIAGASLEPLQPVLGPLVRAAWGISLVSGGVVLLLAAGWAWRRALERRRSPAWSETWACGYLGSTPRMQYTAASFAAPLLQAFGRAAGVRLERAPAAFHTHPVDLVLDGVVLPAWRQVWRVAEAIRPVQQGRLHTYLLYIVGVLLALLLYLWLGA